MEKVGAAIGVVVGGAPGAAAGTLAGNGLNGLQASKTTAVAPGGSDRNLGGKAKQVLPAKEAAKEVAVDYPITPIVTRN